MQVALCVDSEEIDPLAESGDNLSTDHHYIKTKKTNAIGEYRLKSRLVCQSRWYDF